MRALKLVVLVATALFISTFSVSAETRTSTWYQVKLGHWATVFTDQNGVPTQYQVITTSEHGLRGYEGVNAVHQFIAQKCARGAEKYRIFWYPPGERQYPQFTDCNGTTTRIELDIDTWLNAIGELPDSVWSDLTGNAGVDFELMPGAPLD